MKKVQEYEAWSSPGMLLSDDYGKELAIQLHSKGIPNDVFLGLNNIPDHTDIENLRLALLDGDVTNEDFIEFCVKNNLTPEITDANSSCKFLEFSFARPLAWIHIPENSDTILLGYIICLLEKENIRVRGYPAAE
jgi:hypothetical protein